MQNQANKRGLHLAVGVVKETTRSPKANRLTRVGAQAGTGEPAILNNNKNIEYQLQVYL